MSINSDKTEMDKTGRQMLDGNGVKFRQNRLESNIKKNVQA